MNTGMVITLAELTEDSDIVHKDMLKALSVRQDPFLRIKEVLWMSSQT